MSANNDLEMFYRIIRPNDLMGRYVLKSFKGGKSPLTAENPAIEMLVKTIIDSRDGRGSGLLKIDELVKKINEAKSKGTGIDGVNFEDIVRVYAVNQVKDNDKYFKNEYQETLDFNRFVGTAQASAKPKIAVIALASPFISQCVRDINKVAIFMNAIPTLELSRAVPYLSVKFQLTRQNDSESYATTPSLIKFLNGAFKPEGSDKTMLNSQYDNQTNADGGKTEIFKSGMELFTAPQTLMSPISSERTIQKRYVPVIDPTRPFMSIESFEIQAAPTVGMFSYKTAKLSITLHDRSRLSEISDLVRPEIYTQTTLSISYGWQHPDQIGSNNSYGDLLNQLVIKNEKYGIVNASFAFDAVGQVKVVLQLAMKGTQELQVLKIAESDEYVNAQKELQDLANMVARIRDKAGFTKPENISKEVRVYQILDAAERGEATFEFKSNELKQLLQNLRSKPRSINSESTRQLAELLEKMYDGSKSASDIVNKTVNSALAKKYKELEEGDDPFLFFYENHPLGEVIKKEIGVKPKSGDKKSKKFVSLAKLLMTFVIQPFQAIRNVDELQILFYQMNSQAGLAGDTNIGAFPIEINRIKQILDEHARKRGNPNMSINEFVLLIQGAFVNDPTAIGYGLRDAYLPRNGSSEPQPNPKVKIEDKIAEAVARNGGGSFRLPVIEAYVETRGGRVFSAGEIEDDKDSSDILRIHVYDKQSSPYEPFLALIKSQTSLQDIIDSSKTKSKIETRQKLDNEMKTLAKQFGLDISTNKKTNKTSVSFGGNQQIKDFISAVLPTITYGTNNTAVINGTLASQQIPLLSTVQMMRTAGRQNNVEPNGSGPGGVPLRIIPSQLDLNTYGCPLLNINQQFFVDFQTGTTVDNIYLLTHLSHTIKQGKFESHMKLVPLDAYGVYESVVSKVQQLSDILKADADKLQ